jgi:hypothetical protein
MHVITTVIIQVVRTIKEMSHSQFQFHSIKKNNGEKIETYNVDSFNIEIQFQIDIQYKLKYFLGPKIRSTDKIVFSS